MKTKDLYSRGIDPRTPGVYEKSNYYPMDGLVHEPILSLSVAGLVFGSRRFLKKVASRDSDKSLVGSVEETEQARTPLLPDDNKVSFPCGSHNSAHFKIHFHFSYIDIGCFVQIYKLCCCSNAM